MGIICGYFAAYNTLVCLLSDAQLGDNGAVTLNILLLEVVQETAAAADHLVHTKAGVGVLLVDLQMLRELIDALREDGDLNLRGTGVVLAAAVGKTPFFS